MELKSIFNSWAKDAKKDYVDQQWLLSKWEVVEGIVWPEEKIKAMVSNITEHLELESSHVMADLGCGGGWIYKELNSSAEKALGLDISMEMLDKALTTCPGKPLVCGEVGCLPFRDNSFDRLLCYFVIINIMDTDYVERAILEMLRVLKTGGKALVGQIPDKQGASKYDEDKQAYVEFCQKNYKLGQSNRDVHAIPINLFDKERILSFLKKQRISYQIHDSFNPFYRPGQPETVEWRFDLVLEKT